MTALHTQRVFCFQGLPASFVACAEKQLLKDPCTAFLCLLDSNEPSDTVRRTWSTTIDPAYPGAHLYVLRCPSGQHASSVVDFLLARADSKSVEADVLFLSDASTPRESKELARWLRSLQQLLDAQLPGTVVRRV